MFDSFLTVIRLLITLSVVIVLAFYGTKFIASRQLIQKGHKTGAMRVVDRIQLGPKSFLSVVEVNANYYLLSSNEQAVQLIKELVDYQPPEFKEQSFEASLASLDFQEILQKQVVRVKNRLRGEKGNGDQKE